MKIWTSCKQTLDKSEFYTDKRCPDGLMYQCKICRSVHLKEYRSTKRGRLLKMMHTSKESSRKRDYFWDLTYEYLESVYDTQKGKCAITGRKMELAPCDRRSSNSKNTITIDRINNNKGYIKDNIQFVTLQANQAKSSYSQEELEEFCLDVLFPE